LLIFGEAQRARYNGSGGGLSPRKSAGKELSSHEDTPLSKAIPSGILGSREKKKGTQKDGTSKEGVSWGPSAFQKGEGQQLRRGQHVHREREPTRVEPERGGGGEFLLGREKALGVWGRATYDKKHGEKKKIEKGKRKFRSSPGEGCRRTCPRS